MRAPAAGVPLPGGSPAPSGIMLMSQAAISAGVSGFPRLGDCANAGLEPRTSAIARRYPRRSLRVRMFHLPAPINRPTRDGVVVLVWESGDWRNSRGLAANTDKLGTSRLHVARFVPRAALQHGSAAVPPPRHAEASECLAQNRLLQCRFRPSPAAIGGYHD